MRRKKDPRVAEGAAQEQVSIEEGMTIVLVTEDIAHAGTVIGVRKTKNMAKIVWRCDYVVMRNTWKVAELGTAAEALKDRRVSLPPWYAREDEGDGNADIAAGVLIATYVRDGTIQVRQGCTADGTLFGVLIAETDDGECDIFPRGIMVDISQFFSYRDMLVAAIGAPAKQEEKKEDAETPPMHVRVPSASPNTGFPVFDLLSNLGQR